LLLFGFPAAAPTFLATNKHKNCVVEGERDLLIKFWHDCHYVWSSRQVLETGANTPRTLYNVYSLTSLFSKYICIKTTCIFIGIKKMKKIFFQLFVNFFLQHFAVNDFFNFPEISKVLRLAEKITMAMFSSTE
jgi:hypothetical protein